MKYIIIAFLYSARACSKSQEDTTTVQNIISEITTPPSTEVMTSGISLADQVTENITLVTTTGQNTSSYRVKDSLPYMI